MVADDKDSDSTVSKYTITNTLKSGVTNSNNRKTVTEGSSYSARLNGLTTSDTVSVTMGGTNVTSTVYSNGIIVIDEVTGNIVITVS